MSYLHLLLTSVVDFLATRQPQEKLLANREFRSWTSCSHVLTSKQETVDLTFFNSMCHTANTGHSSGNRQGCLNGTRKEILLQLNTWLIEGSTSGSPIYGCRRPVCQIYLQTLLFHQMPFSIDVTWLLALETIVDCVYVGAMFAA